MNILHYSNVSVLLLSVVFVSAACFSSSFKEKILTINSFIYSSGNKMYCWTIKASVGNV